MQKRKSDIESQLRRAIIESSMSRYKIAKLSGIGEAPLSLFVNRKRTLTLNSAAKVAEVLGLELVPKKKVKKGKVTMKKPLPQRRVIFVRKMM